MARHQCAHEACRVSEPLNLPMYTVEAKELSDVQAALLFANEHDIAVSVNSSGHSFEGQSTLAGSLQI